MSLRERSIQRISEACAELYDAKKRKGPDVVWVPKLGPCTAWERDVVRQLVAQRITYDAAMGAWFTP